MMAGPLTGTGILVTRAGEQAGEMAERLAAAGAEVHAVAAIAVEPLPDPAGLAEALDLLPSFDALLLTSANGVRFLLPHLAARRMTPAETPPALCVGPKTAAAWEEAGGRLLGVPPRFTGEALAEWLPHPAGKRYLLLRPEKVVTDLAGLLAARGAAVTAVSLYRTLAGEGEGEKLRALLAAGRVAVVTALSPSAVRGVVELAGEAAPALRALPLLAIGPKTAEAARAAGFTRVSFPAAHTAEGMVEELVRGDWRKQ